MSSRREAAGEESPFLGDHESGPWTTGYSLPLFCYDTAGRVMKIFLYALFWMVALPCQGCSAESFKRTIYDVLQNWGEQHCQQEPGRECPEPHDYDEYQRERNVSQTDGGRP